MGASAIRRAVLTCAVVVLLGLSVAGVAAQTPTPAPTTGGTFTGKISKTSPLTVNSNGQDRQVNTTANTTVVRDGKAATVGDLKVGDQVNVSSNPDNTVSKIETTSAAKSSSAGFLKWLIPLLIVLLILGLIAYLLSRRKKDDFVLERDRTNTPRA
jgi:ATP-dependent Zn protease